MRIAIVKKELVSDKTSVHREMKHVENQNGGRHARHVIHRKASLKATAFVHKKINKKGGKNCGYVKNKINKYAPTIKIHQVQKKINGRNV